MGDAARARPLRKRKAGATKPNVMSSPYQMSLCRQRSARYASQACAAIIISTATPRYMSIARSRPAAGAVTTSLTCVLECGSQEALDALLDGGTALQRTADRLL